MNQEYKFKGKGLFYIAASVCFLSVILFPLGLYFIYMGRTAKIIIRDDVFQYYMWGKNEINYGEIKSLTIKRLANANYIIGDQRINFATVVPFEIETQAGKKVRMSLNYFEKPEEILSILEHKTGLHAIVE